MKKKAIHLTFKNNSDEDNLYFWICSHTNKCGFIKDILMRAKKEEERRNKRVVKGFLKLED